ncbi:ATPase domain-containing protein [Methanohalophilus sp.]|uniref:RAD55 family ATPase n=1 Tax=Methanohalophilus sp. TaxID=1966352 RepID=UPI00262229C6|nr:ATPase domain-containing protein [Methanohalophilus sp.]
MERIPTGIAKLDQELEGGLPINKGILVTGTAGSGKTIFGLHVINRACEDGKNCLILATEETKEDIIAEAENFGFAFSHYLEEELLTITKVLEMRSKTTTASSHLTSGLSIREIDIIGLADLVPENVDLVLIDNIGVFALGMSLGDFRDQFDTLNLLLSEKSVTAIYVLDQATHELTNYVADYSTYGCIKFLVKENPYTSKMERFIFIPKMRGTNISLDLNKFVITPEGMRVIGPTE